MRLILAIIILCAVARADTKITWLADVTADRAETVTGVQSGQVANAVAHINRTDNPHGVTAPQIGALTAEQDLAALRAYHYGSPDIVESPAEWFFFDGAGTITAFDWAEGRENVVIPWEIGGVTVTAIGAYAFLTSSSVSVIAPQTVTTIGNNAFNGCSSLTSVSLPQAQTIGGAAFVNCTSLASVRMGQNAPAEAAGVFEYITPPPNVYVTDPQATGWSATWNGAPVVRPPLYADAITLNGDTITEWPSGGGETSIIAPLYESGTNITVTSTQSVYSVAVTGAGPVGIDWSGLCLDGTGRAEITLRLNVTEWAGTNVTFAPSLTFDATPEILVTGVWEFAASTIDGVTTRVRQTWPEVYPWRVLDYVGGDALGVIEPGAAVQSKANTNIVYFRNSFPCCPILVRLKWYSFLARHDGDFVIGAAFHSFSLNNSQNFSTSYVAQAASGTFPLKTTYIPVTTISSSAIVFSRCGFFEPTDWYIRYWFGDQSHRPANANERAAYEAGWRQ